MDFANNIQVDHVAPTLFQTCLNTCVRRRTSALRRAQTLHGLSITDVIARIVLGRATAAIKPKIRWERELINGNRFIVTTLSYLLCSTVILRTSVAAIDTAKLTTAFIARPSSALHNSIIILLFTQRLLRPYQVLCLVLKSILFMRVSKTVHGTHKAILNGLIVVLFVI